VYSRPSERGQTLVEFALAFPLFLILLLGTIEFAFIFNATLAVNFASRNASLVAAEAGSNGWSDCAILQSVEGDLGAPLDRSLIQTVTIYQADRSGAPVPGVQNVYTRTTGSTLGGCAGFIALPYVLGAIPNDTFPGSFRCDAISGCPNGTSPETYRPLDSVGVRVHYRYTYHTPLRNLVAFLPGAATGQFDVVWSNVMRMEPIL